MKRNEAPHRAPQPLHPIGLGYGTMKLSLAVRPHKYRVRAVPRPVGKRWQSINGQRRPLPLIHGTDTEERTGWTPFFVPGGLVRVCSKRQGLDKRESDSMSSLNSRL